MARKYAIDTPDDMVLQEGMVLTYNMLKKFIFTISLNESSENACKPVRKIHIPH